MLGLLSLTAPLRQVWLWSFHGAIHNRGFDLELAGCASFNGAYQKLLPFAQQIRVPLKLDLALTRASLPHRWTREMRLRGWVNNIGAIGPSVFRGPPVEVDRASA